jgi:phospholipid/cholesterol/gamma-HCH transport system ATP-binding protein
MIQLRDIHVSYGEHPALSGLSLSIQRGDLLGIIGPGGAGKSSVCRLVAGLLFPQRGTITADGVDLARLDSRGLREWQKGIGMQFQNDALFEHMSVLDNVMYPLKRLTRDPASTISERAAAQIAQVGLAGFEAQLPNRLSGGQRRRVALARACVIQPRILICDDPTAGLDPLTSRHILDMIADMRQRTGSTVLLVSSDVMGVLSISTRIALVWRGTIAEDNPPDLFRQSGEKRVRRFLDDARLPFAGAS